MGVGIGLLLVLAGLRVETSTPDTLCPPLSSVQVAVEARVGELRGGDFVATYTVVRGTEEQGDAVELVLVSEEGEVLIERSLPLGTMACSDAATAIALVLDRYFEQLASVAPPLDSTAPQFEELTTLREVEEAEAVAIDEAEAGTSRGSSSSEESSAELRDTSPEKRTTSRWGLHLQAGITIDPTPFLGLGVGYAFLPNWELALDAVIPLLSHEEQAAEGVSADSYNPVLLASLRFQSDVGDWSLGGGPLTLAWLQLARLQSSEEVENPTTKGRVLIGLGAQGSARLTVSPRIQLELGLRAAPLFSSATREFTIAESDGSETSILAPPQFFGGAFVGGRLLF